MMRTVFKIKFQNMKKLYIISVLMLGFISNAQNKHEFSVYAGGVFTRMNYELNQGNAKLGNGGQFGLGYSYYFTPQWSLGIGVEYQMFNSELYFRNLSGHKNYTDSEGDNFEFRFNTEKLLEKQNAQYLTIPLKVQFETKGYTRWFVSAGGKVGLNLSADYETEIGKLTTSGYYPQWNVELNDPQFMGFGQWENISTDKQDLNLKTLFMLTAETGIKETLNDNSSLYFGVYLDYGLNNLTPDSNGKKVVEYNAASPTDFGINSVSTSTNSNNVPYTDDLKFVSFGFKLKYAFGK